jgi:hypothetical protein
MKNRKLSLLILLATLNILLNIGVAKTAVAQKTDIKKQLAERLKQINQATTKSVKEELKQLLPELKDALTQGIAAKDKPLIIRKNLGAIITKHFKKLSNSQRDLLLLLALGEMKGSVPGVTALISSPTSPEAKIIDQIVAPVYQETRSVEPSAVKNVVALDASALAGGANPLEAQTGKLGEVVFNGKWRFQVTKIDTLTSPWSSQKKLMIDHGVVSSVAEYNHESDFSKVTFTPKKGQKFVLVHCIAKNAIPNEKQALWFASTDIMTSVTDGDGSAYPVLVLDIAAPSGPQSPTLLPGAKLEFDALFAIPEGAIVKEMIFTLRTINDKGSNVRIALE